MWSTVLIRRPSLQDTAYLAFHIQIFWHDSLQQLISEVLGASSENCLKSTFAAGYCTRLHWWSSPVVVRAAKMSIRVCKRCACYFALFCVCGKRMGLGILQYEGKKSEVEGMHEWIVGSKKFDFGKLFLNLSRTSETTHLGQIYQNTSKNHSSRVKKATYEMVSNSAEHCISPLQNRS